VYQCNAWKIGRNNFITMWSARAVKYTPWGGGGGYFKMSQIDTWGSMGGPKSSKILISII
jgi:hypothetical protein